MMLIHGRKKYMIKDCRGISSLRGLMFDAMSGKDGALIYGNSVWMPFVRHRLQLIFIDRAGIVVKTEDAVPMTLDPGSWKVYSCTGAVKCLEMKTRIDVR